MIFSLRVSAWLMAWKKRLSRSLSWPVAWVSIMVCSSVVLVWIIWLTALFCDGSFWAKKSASLSIFVWSCWLV